jgi:hypothetical protein
MVSTSRLVLSTNRPALGQGWHSARGQNLKIKKLKN